MSHFAAKIDRLIHDLKSQGEVYSVDTNQAWSDKLQKPAALKTLYRTTQGKRDIILTTFSEVEIVRELMQRWNRATKHGRKLKKAN